MTSNVLSSSQSIFLYFILPYFLKTFVYITIFCLVLGHAGQNLPKHQVGQRPIGLSFIERVYSHLINRIGCKGYDSLLGCYSPPITCLLYFSWFLLVWLLVLCLQEILLEDGSEVKSQKAIISQKLLRIQNTGMMVFLFYSFGLALYFYFNKTVSFPGNARPPSSKLKRKATFEDKERTLNTNGRFWHAMFDQDSYQITNQQFHLQKEEETKSEDFKSAANNTKKEFISTNVFPDDPSLKIYKGLTGESAGRQIWMSSSTPKSSLSASEEKLIQTYASGGTSTSFNPSKNPNTSDYFYRFQLIQSYLQRQSPPPLSPPTSISNAIHKACHFYSMLQTSDGHFGGDYGGPHFLMPGLIISWYVMNRPSNLLNEFQRDMMKQYLLNHQQLDGGWGTHIESPSTMFGTVLSYISLRLLGCEAHQPEIVKARTFIRDHGGALTTSSWAKFWCCLLGVMDWKGHNVVPPEMWLLPNWMIFHPSRLWCHCRMVYLPMGYLYGEKFVYPNAEKDKLISELRKELYIEEYEQIDWGKTRHEIADMDNYSPIPLLMMLLQNLLFFYEYSSIFSFFRNYVRKQGIDFSLQYLTAEDLQTNYINIGPVNKVLNMLCAYHASSLNVQHITVQNHFMRVPDYLWLAEDGMKMQGYNGSQCWDTCFAIQAFEECQMLDKFQDVSKKVWEYLEKTQILSTATSKASPAYMFESASYRCQFYRHLSYGGWPFSTSAHGWPISDCTSEGLKSVLALFHHSQIISKNVTQGFLKHIDSTRLLNAVEVILTLQNEEDGGWATYENNRGYGFYELLNPSEVFGDIMIDYSYVECSSACITALVDFVKFEKANVTKQKLAQIQIAIQKGCTFIKTIQRDDGSWYGSWACCFTYGIWFGIEALVKADEANSTRHVQKAVNFLLNHQNPNGGWGEDFSSCYNKSYAADGMSQYGDEEGSSIVCTAWALLGLSCAKCQNKEAVKRGVSYLLKRQLDTGDWPQEGISGVFNRACGITYTAYRNVFPIWALGRCVSTYGQEMFALNADKN